MDLKNSLFRFSSLPVLLQEPKADSFAKNCSNRERRTGAEELKRQGLCLDGEAGAFEFSYIFLLPPFSSRLSAFPPDPRR